MPGRRKRGIQKGGLKALRRAYLKRDYAQKKLRREILFAHLDGSSLRAIAETVSLSPESVRTIIRNEIGKREQVRARLATPIAGLTVGAREKEAATRRRLAREWRLKL
jgi:DNA invertase Pin-like site-specific DNA recombinase